MAGKGKLASTVYVVENGIPVGYGPDSEDIPEASARQIGEHAWEGGKHPYPAKKSAKADLPADAVTAPNSKAKGARDEWAAYAASQGVVVEPEDDTAAIVAAVEAHESGDDESE